MEAEANHSWLDTVSSTHDILHQLMDGIEPEHVAAARKAATSVPGVQDATVRGRWMGRSLTLEVEGRMPKDTTLEHAEETGHKVEAVVRAAVEEVRHVRFIPRRTDDHR
jgi:divalent metal cation (Fe/Co/Zn/Cd) transporter